MTKKKKNKNRTTEIMNGHTDRLINEGIINSSFDMESMTLTINMNLEIIKYHRPRSNRFTTYDPMSKYKKVLKTLIKNSLKENNIVIPEEFKEMPIDIECNYYAIPTKSGNSLGVISLMLNNLIKRTKYPDVDNFNKTVYDVLNTITWNDDGQIFKENGNKLYGKEEGTEIRIKYIPNHGYAENENTDFRKLLKEGIITDHDLETARLIKNNKIK